jgi:hypothetical protein
VPRRVATLQHRHGLHAAQRAKIRPRRVTA